MVSLHLPLIQALTAFTRVSLLPSQTLFHGCGRHAPHTDFASRLLLGTRKWFSSDPVYASDYAGAYSHCHEGGLLWICRLACAIPSLLGSQNSLAGVAPWPPNEFPWMLPNSFEAYAGAVLKCQGSVALLDHPYPPGFREILITSPANVIEVLDVIELPSDREKARSMASSLIRSCN